MGEKGQSYDFGIDTARATKSLKDVTDGANEAAKAISNMDKKAQRFSDDALRKASTRQSGGLGEFTREEAQDRMAEKVAAKLKAERLRKQATEQVSEATEKATENTKKYAGATDLAEKSSRSASHGVSMLTRKVRHLVTAYLGYHAIKNVIGGLFNTGHHMENLSNDLAISFGNQTNAINALTWANEQAAKGKSAFAAEDVVRGMDRLQKVGLDGKKSFKLVSNMAGAANKSFTETSEAINQAIHGNFAAFEEYGIQEIYMRQFKALRNNTPAMKGAIMNYLATQKMFVDGTKNALNTWDAIMVGIKANMQEFREAIMGRPDDENSLYNKVKNSFAKLRDFLSRHAETIKKIGRGIGLVFKWVWRQIEIVFSKIARSIGKSMDDSNGFFHNFEKRMMSVVLWLELAKIKVVKFFREYATEIKVILGLFATFVALQKMFKVSQWIKSLTGFGSGGLMEKVFGKKGMGGGCCCCDGGLGGNGKGKGKGVPGTPTTGKGFMYKAGAAAKVALEAIKNYAPKVVKVGGVAAAVIDPVTMGTGDSPKKNLEEKKKIDAKFQKFQQENKQKELVKALNSKKMDKAASAVRDMGEGNRRILASSISININGSGDPYLVALEVKKILEEKQSEMESRKGKR